MTGQDFISQYGAVTDKKTVPFLSWEVIQQFEGPNFDGYDFWNGDPVEAWVIMGYRNASGIFCKWKCIAVYQKKESRHKDAEMIYTTRVKDDPYNRDWINRNGLPIVRSYGGNITLRQLHYRLVSIHMPNSFQHYKRVVTAMIEARWDGNAGFDEFVDRDRETIGRTPYEDTDPESEAETGKTQIKLWMDSYHKNRWENQDYYVEVWIEKKALQGVFERPCQRSRVALNPCKGNPSLTFLYDGMNRMKEAADEGKQVVVLYFGDYDPTGEDIPRSIEENFQRMGFHEFELKRILLMEHQVDEMNLPIAPVKMSDRRTAAWDGKGQVELDAIEPSELQRICQEAIDDHFDDDAHDELLEQEEEEKETYRSILKEFVANIDTDDDN